MKKKKLIMGLLAAGLLVSSLSRLLGPGLHCSNAVIGFMEGMGVGLILVALFVPVLKRAKG